jgi:hypothetical protein
VRAFISRDGTDWDVVVGRESWGTLVVMFIPRSGDARPRQTVLESGSAEEALSELRAMTDSELQDLLDKAGPKPTE